MLKHLLRADGLAAGALARAVQTFSSRHTMDRRTVLDLGCGSMPYRSLFTAKGARYVGADIDGSPDVLIRADAPIPIHDSSMDYVVSFQVLEHVRDVPAYLATVRRVLNMEGRFFLSTHGVWPYHPHPTDYWRWTRDGLQEIMEEAGFRIEKMTAICGPAAWIAMFPMLAIKRLLDPVSAMMFPANLCVNLLAGSIDVLTPSGIREANASIYAIEAAPVT